MTRPLRLGIVGAGGAAALVGEASREADGIELRACAASTPQSAERFAREHAVPRAYASFEQLLADDDVEAVHVATPNALHHAHALAAIAAGKHVLVEKPMTLGSSEANELAAASDRRALVLGVGFHLRHSEVFRELERLLHGGAVGEPRFVRAGWGMPLPELSGWKQNRALAGAGALMGLGVHVLDLVLWLLEGARGAVAAVSDARGAELDRNYAVVLELGRCIVALSVSRSFALGASIAIFGSEGVLIAEDALTVRAEGVLRDGQGKVLANAARNPYAAELEAFAAAARGGPPFHADARDGVRCVELTEAVLAGTAS